MSAIDGSGFLNWTNQPDIYCISMTDSADNFEGTMYGPYIDFAAPGWEIYSTTTGSGYDYGSGTSYAAPLFSGVVGWMLSINPALSPDGVIGILTNTAVDLGPPGWDEYFGWGRINFGAAAAATIATLPTISNIQVANSQVTISANYYPGLNYVLWQTSQLAPSNWLPVTNTITSTNSNVIMFVVPLPAAPESFYRISELRPRESPRRHKLFPTPSWVYRSPAWPAVNRCVFLGRGSIAFRQPIAGLRPEFLLCPATDGQADVTTALQQDRLAILRPHEIREWRTLGARHQVILSGNQIQHRAGDVVQLGRCVCPRSSALGSADSAGKGI